MVARPEVGGNDFADAFKPEHGHELVALNMHCHCSCGFAHQPLHYTCIETLEVQKRDVCL